MKRSLVLCFTTALLLSTVHRAPAPISEIPESPTPAHEQSVKRKRSEKSFAGIWKGTESTNIKGVDFSNFIQVRISKDERIADEGYHNLAHRSGDTLKWVFSNSYVKPPVSSVRTLTLNGDNSATYTSTLSLQRENGGWVVVATGRGTFHRQ
jgi:hypothetical protein